MKHLNRIIALALTVAMVFTLSLTAYAVPVRHHEDLAKPAPVGEKGFRSPEFTLSNDHVYKDDDIVRAIVFLEGAPEIERAGGNLVYAQGLRTEILDQHKVVLDQMKKVKFTKEFEFTSLLNGFSIDVAYGDLDYIADLPGVSSVHIANRYAAPEVNPIETRSVIGSIYTGNTAAATAGYDGSGMVVAVLDTGLNTTHEAFQDVTDLCEKSAVLDESCLEKAKAPGAYLSPKVPFAYDYADKDADVTDLVGHGTHVSGIATGYAVNEEGAVLFHGAAPAAQLLSMKVFSDTSPYATSDIYFQALEDAYRLGADVINMSLGAQNGFTYDASLETEVFGNIYKRLDEAGVILSIAASNEGSMADNSTMGFIGADYMDYGTVGSPATYDGNLSVAAMENAIYPQLVFNLDGKAYAYNDSSMTPENSMGLWRSTFGDQDVSFAVVKTADGTIGLGKPEEYASNNVEGKIAVIQRGEISFQEKVTFAAEAGAIGLIVCNNEPGHIGMSIQDFAVPAIAVEQELQDAFLNAAADTIFVPSAQFEQENPRAFEICDFSGWGTSPSLTIDPAITSFGGMINSAYIENDQSYTVMSGTSMAAPFMTGTIANLLSYLQDKGLIDKVERAQAAEAMLESSAIIATDGDSLFAVRRQGAGLANVMNAIENYENAGYIQDPLKELGDDAEKTGVYSFDFTLYNSSEEDVHYDDFQVSVLADQLANINNEEQPVIANQLKSRMLLNGGLDSGFFTVEVDGASASSLDLASGDSATVTVTITLTADAKAYLDQFPNGSFVEGFVSCTANEKYENHATFLSFYGDWNAAPVVEQEDFRSFLETAYQLTTIPGDAEGHSLADLGVKPLDVMHVYTQPNQAFAFNSKTEQPVFYPGGSLLADLPYQEAYAAFATAQSKSAFCDSLVVQPYQLRNASALSMTVTDVDTGEVYFSQEEQYVPKAAFDAENKIWQSMIYYLWNGTDQKGKAVPSGTVVNVCLNAVLPYSDLGSEEGTEVEDVWNFNVTVDYTAPELDTASVKLDSSNGTLTVTAEDEQYLQAIFLRDPRTTSMENMVIYDAKVCTPETEGESITATFDIKPLLAAGIGNVDIVAMDYATNNTAYNVSLYEAGQTAEVTLVSATGKTTVSSVKTGETFIFPDCEEELEGARFEGWTTQEFEHLSLEDYDKIAKFYPGDRMTVIGDCTFYALYAVGYDVKSDVTQYALTGQTGSGDYAIVGLGINAAGNAYDPTHPYALGKTAETLDMTKLPDTVVDQQYIAFKTADTGIRYSFETVGADQFTIRNAETGKYLAMTAEGAFTMADEVTDYAKWNVKPHSVAQYAVEITNAADDGNMMLLFNYVNSQFVLLNRNTVVGTDGSGTEIHAYEAFQAYLYNAFDAQFEADYLTTNADAIVHTCKWDAGTVTKEPTCTEDGEMTYTCLGCGKTRTEVIPAGHDWDEGTIEVEPSCSQEGKITYTCRRCGEKKTEVMPKTPHAWDNGTITKEATCTEYGEKTYTCSACGETKTVMLPNLGGHRYDNGTVTKEPAIGVEGEKVYTCLVCGQEHIEKLPALEDPNPTNPTDPEPTDPINPTEPEKPEDHKCYFKTFDDCKHQWYHEAVDFMVSKGLMTGMGGKSFAPNSGLTRAMMVTVLYSEAGKPEVSAPSTFTDVPKDQWYSDPVAWAQDCMIVAGVLPNKFAPNVLITREQVAMILWRNSGSPEASADLKDFKDAAKISGYAVPAMKWAVEAGIMDGDDHSCLNPGQPATRAEFAIMMMRYLNGSYDCNER